MKPVLVKKAYLPTLGESDLTLDDITSLRWIPSYRRSTFNLQQPVRRNISNIDWETRLMGEEGKKPLPGFAEGRNLTGYFVNPAVRMGALHGDVTFKDKGILMGIAERPHFWRTPQQGAADMSIAGEGFRYNQLPKEAFVDLQADYSPVDAQQALLEWERGQRMEGKKASESFDDLATSSPEVYDIASILPATRTENIWGQPAILTQNPLTDFDASQYKVASEPMDIAFQLLKERVSPEAKRHKLEYDKKYESSPERVKYREELNRERRRRGIYGSHDHKDISHTEGGKLTLEGEHENRARHFKDKGTLRELNKAQQTLPSYDRSQVESLTKPNQSTMYISSRPGRKKVTAKEQSERHDALLAAIAELNRNKQMNIMTGTGEGEWGKEHSIVIQNYPQEMKEKLYALASQFGQDAVAESNAREKGMRFVNPVTSKDTFSFGAREIQENPRYSTNFPTGQKITFTE